MWIIAKIKTNCTSIFKKELERKVKKKVDFYTPKILIENSIKGKKVSKEKSILEDYIFCKSESFNDEKNLRKYFFTRGLKFFLSGNIFAQNEIIKFISDCKKNEDQQGYIKNNFFYSLINNKGKFINGPLKNLIFEIVEKRKNKLKVSLGNYLITVGEKGKNFLQPI